MKQCPKIQVSIYFLSLLGGGSLICPSVWGENLTKLCSASSGFCWYCHQCCLVLLAQLLWGNRCYTDRKQLLFQLISNS